MPLSLALLIIGVILIVVAYYVPTPPPLKTLLMALGVICVAVGAILLVYALLTGAVIGGRLAAAIVTGL